MKKSKFNLTHLHSTTLDPGYLVPFCLIPTLPNDSFRIGLSTFIRAQPMLAPLMHEVRLFTQYWFCPLRILWDEWEDFITGGPDLASTPALPTVISDAEDVKPGSLWDYLGFPLIENLEVSALPFRAMAEIWNTRYRDEDLQDEVPIDYSSDVDDITSRKLLSPSFAKDYFTTARPFTQRGGDILVPVSEAPNTGTNTGYNIDFDVVIGVLTKTETWGGSSQLVTCNVNFNTSSFESAISKWLSDKVTDGSIDNLLMAFPTDRAGISALSAADFEAREAFLVGNSQYNPGNVIYRVYVFPKTSTNFTSPNVVNSSINTTIQTDLSCPGYAFGPGAGTGNGAAITLADGGNVKIRFAGRWLGQNVQVPNFASPNAPLSEITYSGQAVVPKTSSTSGFSIRDLRRSAALQRYAERSLKYGNRYEEFIQREFGIKPRDYRIQRPEYLGGGRGILNISEVLQTAESTDTGVGTMRGHGVASISQRPIRFRCPEHGLIIGLLSIRPKSVYTQGIDREWLKRSRLDFFTPELASIGMQEVLQQELFATADNKNEIFGYSERYQEYRYQKPLVTGEFRTNLNFWNMARVFQNAPNLNDEFINMAHSVNDFKRPFQIQDNSAHAFVCMLKNHIRAYRAIPKRAKEVLR